MNLSAGSDPSLNFPKPIPISPAYLTKPQTTQQSAPVAPRRLSTHALPQQRGHPWGIATCLIRIIFPPPSSNRQPHWGLLARHYSPTLPTTAKIAYIASASTLIVNTDHICPSNSAPCQIPSPPGFTATLFASGYPIRSR